MPRAAPARIQIGPPAMPRAAPARIQIGSPVPVRRSLQYLICMCMSSTGVGGEWGGC